LLEKTGKRVISRSNLSLQSKKEYSSNTVSHGLPDIPTWPGEGQPLDEWADRFMMAQRTPQPAEGAVEVIAAVLEAERIFADAAHNFRTPRKRKTPDTLEEPMVGVSPYRCQISESDFESCNSDEKVRKLIEIGLMLDVGLTASSKGLENLVIDFAAANTYYNQAVSALEFRVDTMATTLGSKSSAMYEDYEASSIWGTLAAVAMKLDKVDGRSRKDWLAAMTKSVKKPVLADRGRSFGTQINSLRADVVQLRDFLPKLIAEFNTNLSGKAARIDQVSADLIQFMASPGAGGGPPASINTGSESQAFSDRLDRFETKLGKAFWL
jgi:hypothetical protein